MTLPNHSIAFDEFTKLLSKRIECFGEKEGPFSLSEDTLCLYIALAYLEAGIEGHRMEMEVSHPLLEKLSGYDPKIDICVRDSDQCVWLEVKFGRRARSNRIMNVT